MPADDTRQLLHAACSSQTERVQARRLDVQEEIAVDLREGIKQLRRRIVALIVRTLLQPNTSLPKAPRSASFARKKTHYQTAIKSLTKSAAQ